MRAVPILLSASLFLLPGLARAAPVSNSGEIEASSKGIRWIAPERVIGGNALSVLLPFQIGVVSYLPKAKVALQYDRQFNKAHWGYVAAGFLADRGNYENFRMKRCGFETAMGNTPQGLCNNGGVAGFDLALGYVHKFYVAKHPWIVPFTRVGAGFAWWKLPSVKGGESARNQIRTSTAAINLQPAGGIRIFITGDVALGMEIQVPLGVAIHRVVTQGGSKRNEASFLLGIATLLGLEYRF